MITTTQLCIIMIIYLVVIIFLLIVLAITNEKIVRQMVRQMDDIEKRANNATTMCEIIKIWDDFEKLYKSSWDKVYGTRLNRIKDMILFKLDSLRNLTSEHL